MPGTDMNTGDLQKYQGCSILPEDFHSFWRRTIEEIEQEEPTIRLESSDIRIPGARCYWGHLHWKSSEGADLYAKIMVPDSGDMTSLPVALVFHDYPEASRSWFHLSRYLSLGMIVVAPDCRDQAGRSHSGRIPRGTGSYGPMFFGLEDEICNLYLTNLYTDAIAWMRALESLPNADIRQVHCYGAGQGAALALVCAYADPQVKSLGLHYPMLCDYRRVWEKDFIQGGYMGLHYYFRWHDPLHEHGEEIFRKLDYVDICNMASSIHTDCLISTGLADTVSPPSCQYAVVNRMTCHVRHLVYPKHGHELNNFFENEYLKFLIDHLE